MRAGDQVEVQNTYVGTWARGFEIVAVERLGYRLRRMSDRCVLPSIVAFEAVRPRSSAPYGRPWGVL